LPEEVPIISNPVTRVFTLHHALRTIVCQFPVTQARSTGDGSGQQPPLHWWFDFQPDPRPVPGVVQSARIFAGV